MIEEQFGEKLEPEVRTMRRIVYPDGAYSEETPMTEAEYREEMKKVREWAARQKESGSARAEREDEEERKELKSERFAEGKQAAMFYISRIPNPIMQERLYLQLNEMDEEVGKGEWQTFFNEAQKVAEDFASAKLSQREQSKLTDAEYLLMRESEEN